jgi:hypothetical protein
MSQRQGSSRKGEAFRVLAQQCGYAGLPEPTPERVFHPTRKWRFDASWLIAPSIMLAMEIDGGVFLPGGGRHNRGAGYRQDQEKLNAAAILGWHVMRVLPEDVTNGKAIIWVAEFFKERGIASRITT